MNLNNKIAVVTGGAGGIGAALCRALASKGAKVVVSDLNLQAAQAVAAEISGLAIACDVSNEAEIQRLISQTEAELGDIDLFISNAGFGVGEPDHAASANDDVWQKNWQLHVMAHVWASRALLPKMIQRGDGYLVNTASAAGLLVQVADAAYSATKHAAVSFAESLAIGHGDDGIKVSVICPQYVNTNILAVADEERGKQMQGVITPDECAATVIKGIEDEVFMILTHPEVADFYRNRANDPSRWVKGMRRYRAAMLDENGKFDFRKVFNI
ncbi:MAG: NAD(P)-dependent dehydrogenase (short-subunit alcohol dehydrogenase family) [Arenicella sp.]|jgi:NAD(P)-dependent dehydrogenase (short-subunit alcohol dehydrogenase family)